MFRYPARLLALLALLLLMGCSRSPTVAPSPTEPAALPPGTPTASPLDSQGATTTPLESPSPSPPEAGVPILTYEEEGGIAGFCDTLIVEVGIARYQTCKGRSAEQTLGEETRRQLVTAYQQFRPFTSGSQDNPGGPDNLIRRLSFSGAGAEEAPESERMALTQLAHTLMRELRQAATQGGEPADDASPAASPAAVDVWDVLATYRDRVSAQSGPNLAAQQALEDGLLAAVPALGGVEAFDDPETVETLRAALGPSNSPVDPEVLGEDADGDGVVDLLVAPGAYGLRPVALLARENEARLVQLLPEGFVALDSGGIARLDRVADVNKDGTPEVVIPFEIQGASAVNTELFVIDWDGERFTPVFRTFLTTWSGGGEWTIHEDGTIATTCAVLGAFDHKLLPHPIQTNLYAWAAGVGYELSATNVEPPATQREQANLAEAALQSGNWAAAIERYQQLLVDESLQAEPDVEVDFVNFAHLRLGQLFALVGRPDAALAELRLASEAGPLIGDLALAFREGYGPEHDTVAGWANMLRVPLYRAAYEERAGNLGFPADPTQVLHLGTGLAAFLNAHPDLLALGDEELTAALAATGLPIQKAAINNLDNDPSAPEIVVDLVIEGSPEVFGPEGRQHQIWLLDQGPQGPGWWSTLLSVGDKRLNGIDRPAGAEAGEVVLDLPGGSEPSQERIRWTGEQALRLSPDGAAVPLNETPGICRPQ